MALPRLLYNENSLELIELIKSSKNKVNKYLFNAFIINVYFWIPRLIQRPR